MLAFRTFNPKQCPAVSAMRKAIIIYTLWRIHPAFIAGCYDNVPSLRFTHESKSIQSICKPFNGGDITFTCLCEFKKARLRPSDLSCESCHIYCFGVCSVIRGILNSFLTVVMFCVKLK